MDEVEKRVMARVNGIHKAARERWNHPDWTAGATVEGYTETPFSVTTPGQANSIIKISAF